MATKKKNPDNQMMTVLLIGGGAFAAYWYATNYGPTGAVHNAAGVKIAPSWWDQMFGATTTAPAATATGAAPNTGATPATTGTAMANAQPAVTITNASGGNSTQFSVGDTVKVTVQGPPNSPVTYTGSLNGQPFNSQTLGTTTQNGVLTWSGVVPDSLVGQITETWFVGQVQVGTIQFTVSPKGTAGISGGEMPMPSFPGRVSSGRTGARIGGKMKGAYIQ